MQKEEVKVTEVKEAAKTAAKTVETKAAPKKAAATKKAVEAKTAVKTTAKKTVAKAAAKKEEAKTEIIVQYQNNEVSLKDLEEKVKAQFVSEGHKAGSIKKLNIYVKPEEYAAYYVINEKFSGRVWLF